MKKSDFYNDRDRKIHRVPKANKVDKHKKTIYNYAVDDEIDDTICDEYEKHQDEVDTSNIH